MNTTQINFKGLDFTNVATADRKYLKNDFKQLRELGRKYDIRLVSTYTDVPGFSAIDVDVRPFGDGLSFFKKIFRPKGKASFQAGKISADGTAKSSLAKSVEEAIVNLERKLHK